jgi:hypothetical protein
VSGRAESFVQMLDRRSVIPTKQGQLSQLSQTAPALRI